MCEKQKLQTERQVPCKSANYIKAPFFYEEYCTFSCKVVMFHAENADMMMRVQLGFQSFAGMYGMYIHVTSYFMSLMHKCYSNISSNMTKSRGMLLACLMRRLRVSVPLQEGSQSPHPLQSPISQSMGQSSTLQSSRWFGRFACIECIAITSLGPKLC